MRAEIGAKAVLNIEVEMGIEQPTRYFICLVSTELFLMIIVLYFTVLSRNLK